MVTITRFHKKAMTIGTTAAAFAIAGAALGGPAAQAAESSHLGQPEQSEAASSASTQAASVSRDTVIKRAQKWADAKVPYDQQAFRDGYRTDCSGFVAMAWGTKTPGFTTDMMHDVGKEIKKSDLKKGDVLLNPNPGNDGHVVIFEKWADSSHTSYVGYEESGKYGTVHRTIDYPYFSHEDQYVAFRYDGIK